ncbi:MAG: hypothetical protein NVSMB9_20690 [Isosphaeraceae bacterium]
MKARRDQTKQFNVALSAWESDEWMTPEVVTNVSALHILFSAPRRDIMRKAAFVRRSPEQREAHNGRWRRHIQILLVTDEGRTDEQIAVATGASHSTVEHHSTQFAREGQEAPEERASKQDRVKLPRRRCP